MPRLAELLFFFFSQKLGIDIQIDMQIVSLGDNLHEMSKPIFLD